MTRASPSTRTDGVAEEADGGNGTDTKEGGETGCGGGGGGGDGFTPPSDMDSGGGVRQRSSRPNRAPPGRDAAASAADIERLNKF